jgi:hypothetical protein
MPHEPYVEPDDSDLFTDSELEGSHPITRRIVREIRRLSVVLKDWQQQEAAKQPDNFAPQQGILVPDQDQTNPIPRLLSGRKANRNTIIIVNTGGSSCFIGSSNNNARNNGFTVLAGATLAIEAKQAVWAWCKSGATTTLDIMETFYGEQ